MPKNTLGQFIGVLRKANGLTQQDVADRLGVSNKAVSRWERDETAPDLFLIPAIAEMFGVSCDELLKGERIINNEEAPSPKNSSTQIKALVLKKLSQFKTNSIISSSLSLAGLILLFGISYGFYKPILAFCVMLLFIIAAFVIALISVNKLREIKNDSETFDLLDIKNQLLFNKTLADFSLLSFFISLAVFIFSSPMLIPSFMEYFGTVLGIRSFFQLNFLNFLILLLIYFYAKEPYFYFITNEKRVKTAEKKKTKFGIIQLILIGASAFILIIAEFFNTHPYKMTPAYFGLTVFSLVLLLAVLIIFIIMIKKKQGIIQGIRNVLLIPVSIIIGQAHSSSFFDYYPAAPEVAERYDIWETKYIGYALLYTLIVLIIYKVIEKIKKAKKEL